MNPRHKKNSGVHKRGRRHYLRRGPIDRFLKLSLEMARHTLGQDFSQAMRSFPSAKFHQWCDLAKLLEFVGEK